MKTFKVIRDEDVGLHTPAPTLYTERQTSRAVVFDESNKIALQYLAYEKYHKLPGGGMEKGESLEDALKRELIEEIGCKIQHVQQLGIVEEYRNKTSIHQISHCFTADLLGDKGLSHLEEAELAEGMETIWVGLSEAIKIIEGETEIEEYKGKFIRLRELIFLKEAFKLGIKK